MQASLITLLSGLLLGLPWALQADPQNRNTDWFHAAHYGVFMHFLPGDAQGLERVREFDVEALARQLEAAGAGYFVLTLGQNSGYFNSPNAAYDRLAGYAPGARCAQRDLPLAVYRALRPRGIRLLLYLPCQVPNRDRQAQAAFGLPVGPADQPIDLAFARKWARVIQEWGDRYGDKVAGWWFDGGYAHIHFSEAIAQVYARAAKHGNPKAIVTFNPGVRVIHYTAAEDYTAGELNEPFDQLPAGRWLDGSQWHALTFLGSGWAQRNTRYTTAQWAAWVGAVVDQGGVVTLDLGPNYDPQAGPIGSLAPAQLQQVQAVRDRVRGSARVPPPRRRRRADSFLGVHFDFHAGPDCTEIGMNTTRAMIEALIAQVRPDYLQIDCKGHPGLSSYPTRVGNRAPGFVGDPLRLWRQVTAEHGVALYMHYSGVWDSEAIRRHPTWAVINADGTTNRNATSFFSPYADQLLIPQLRELAGDYGVDGAWMDGECWAAMPDYGRAAVRAFGAATGIHDPPRGAADPHWYEFLQFNREAFRRYLRHYLTEVKRTNPRVQLCSNWAFSDHMPEPVSAPVDWLSGDFSPQDSVNSARMSARYLAGQEKPWDLMAWSFTTKPGRGGGNQKSVVQLEREAAIVLAQGGGFQAYFQQKRDGSLREEGFRTMAAVARFCRARQALCHHAVAVPQVALLYSTADHYRQIQGLFNRDLSRLNGTLQALLETQHSVEVLSEHRLTGRMRQYGLIVVPECEYLEPRFKQELVRYVDQGGSLLLVGSAAAGMFQPELGLSLDSPPGARPGYLALAQTLEPVQGALGGVHLGARARPVGQLQATPETATALGPAAAVAPLGRGLVGGVFFAFSESYLSQRSAAQRAFLQTLVRELFPKPMVEVSGSPEVEVAVNRLRGRLHLNLVNTAGPHVEEPILETIPPVGPLAVTVRTGQKPARIRLEPEGQALKFDYDGTETHFEVPRLELHSIVVVE